MYTCACAWVEGWVGGWVGEYIHIQTAIHRSIHMSAHNRAHTCVRPSIPSSTHRNKLRAQLSDVRMSRLSRTCTHACMRTYATTCMQIYTCVQCTGTG